MASARKAQILFVSGSLTREWEHQSWRLISKWIGEKRKPTAYGGQDERFRDNRHASRAERS